MKESLKLQLFEQKQKFLREIPHPKLILKEIKILNRSIDGTEELTFDFFEQELKANIKEQELTFFLEAHITEQLQLKHDISKAQTALELRQVLTELYQFQIILLKKLQSYVPNSIPLQDEEIKMSVPIDVYAILKRIHASNLKEKEIKDYLCRVIKAQEKPFEKFIENCLRANKILSHV